MQGVRDIRPMRVGDVAVLATLAAEIWREYYTSLIGVQQVDYMVERFQSEAAIRQQVADGYEYFMVGGLQPVAYFAVQARPAEGALFISKFYVRGRERGRGTGRVCMEFIERLARDRGLSVLWLTVHKRNPSVQVYQRLGFEIVADIVTDIGDGFVMDDFRMEKPLAT